MSDIGATRHILPSLAVQQLPQNFIPDNLRRKWARKYGADAGNFASNDSGADLIESVTKWPVAIERTSPGNRPSLFRPRSTCCAFGSALTRSGTVARIPSKLIDIAAIDARREALRAELAKLDEQARAAEVAARDAGRSILLLALDRVKIAAMGKKDAKLIASAIGTHGGTAVAQHLLLLNAS
jgi:hypothetical protein